MVEFGIAVFDHVELKDKMITARSNVFWQVSCLRMNAHLVGTPACVLRARTVKLATVTEKGDLVFLKAT